MSSAEQREYIAFISYRHCPLDRAAAVKLQRSIESYTVPKELREQFGGKKLGMVFRDEDELPASSSLSDSITYALDHSRYLLVVCTPDLPKSRWCEQEIRYFLQTHDRDHILAVLADGEPGESFSPLLLHTFDEDGNITGDTEPLAANISGPDHTLSRRAYRKEIVRVYAALLGCPFDALWQRERRAKTNRAVAALAVVMAVMAGFIGLVLNRNARISAQNEQITLQNGQITEQMEALRERNEQINAQNEQITEQSERIADQYASLQRQYSALLVDTGFSQLEEYDVSGALESGLEAMLTAEEAELRDPRAELLLGQALGAYVTDSERSRLVYEQKEDILELKRTADGRYVLLTDRVGMVRCLSTESWKVLWTADCRDLYNGRTGFGGIQVELLLPEEGDVVLCSCVTGISARSLEDGREVWRYTLQSNAENAYRSLEGNLLLFPDHAGPQDKTVVLRVLDPRTGALLGERPLGPDVGDSVYLSSYDPFSDVYNKRLWESALSRDGSQCAVAYYTSRTYQDEEGRDRSRSELCFTVFRTDDWSISWTSRTEEAFSSKSIIYDLAFTDDGALFCARFIINLGGIRLTRAEPNGGNSAHVLINHAIGSPGGTGLDGYAPRVIPSVSDGRRYILCSDRTFFLIDMQDLTVMKNLSFLDDILAVVWKDEARTTLWFWIGNGVIAEFLLSREPGMAFENFGFMRFDQQSILAAYPASGPEDDRLELLTIPAADPGRLLLLERISDPAGTLLPMPPEGNTKDSVFRIAASGSRILAFRWNRETGASLAAYDADTLEEQACFQMGNDGFSEYCNVYSIDDNHFLCGAQVCSMDGSRRFLEGISENDYKPEMSMYSVHTADGRLITLQTKSPFLNPVACPVWVDGEPAAGAPELIIWGDAVTALGGSGWIAGRGNCGFMTEDGVDPARSEGAKLVAINVLTGERRILKDQEPESGDCILTVGTTGPSFACAYNSGLICLFNAETGDCLELAGLYGIEEISAMCYVPGDEWLLVLTHQDKLDILNAKDGELVFSEELSWISELPDWQKPNTISCSRDRKGRLHILTARRAYPRISQWCCIDPAASCIVGHADGIIAADTFNGLLCALREDLVLAYPLRDAEALGAWAEEVLLQQEN